MKLSPVLNTQPIFHFWKDFGAGRKRRIPYYQIWKKNWRLDIGRRKVEDFTLSHDQLPPGSRILDAEDFMTAHLDAMPDDIMKAKNEKVVYDHPWPFNVNQDRFKNQTPHFLYTIDTRFYVPREDGLVLTNTLLVDNNFEPKPPFEPTEEHLSLVKRQYDWATKGDNVLVRLPRIREWPKINIKPPAKYGITKERQEVNIINSLSEISQTLLSQYYNEKKDEKLAELLHRRSLAFPHCDIAINRHSETIVLNLCVDHMTLSHSPLKPIDLNVDLTRDSDPVDISPRSWKSVLEKSRNYSNDWTFKLPCHAFPHTIQLASRIKRNHRNQDEMLARSLVHAFGVTSQFARSAALDTLKNPVVLQVIGFEAPLNFYFLRYQLNTMDFDDSNPRRVKNQAWYSGPVNDLHQALRYYIDFQS